MATVYGNTVSSTWRSYLTYSVSETATDYTITVNDVGVDIVSSTYYLGYGSNDTIMNLELGLDGFSASYNADIETDRSLLENFIFQNEEVKTFSTTISKTQYTQSIPVLFEYYTNGSWIKVNKKTQTGTGESSAKSAASVTLTVPTLAKPTVSLIAERDSSTDSTVKYTATIKSFSNDAISNCKLTVNGTEYTLTNGIVPSSGTLNIYKTLTNQTINKITATLVATGEGGTSNTYILNIPPAFYTLDIGNKGKEIAFGQSATTDQSMIPSNGLFSCGMSPIFFSLAGEIKMWAGDAIPYGWLLCDGSEVSKTKYPNLYAAIGDLWGVPSSSSNFKLPNLTGRVPVGYNSTDTDTTETFGQVGATGGARGAWYHTHTIGSSGAHSHASQGRMEGSGTGANIFESYNGASKTRSVNVPRTGTNGNHTHSPGSSGSAGNKLAADKANMPPYAVVKYIICAI